MPYVRVIGVDQWGNFLQAESAGGRENPGSFEMQIGEDSREYYVTVVDDQGAPLSFSVTIQHRTGELAAAACHEILWQYQAAQP